MAEDPSESRSGRLRILVEPEASVLSQGNSRGIVRKCQGRGQATLLDRDAGILLDEEQRGREKLCMGWPAGSGPRKPLCRCVGLL